MPGISANTAVDPQQVARICASQKKSDIPPMVDVSLGGVLLFPKAFFSTSDQPTPLVYQRASSHFLRIPNEMAMILSILSMLFSNFISNLDPGI
jgi:hypothetical protein